MAYRSPLANNVAGQIRKVNEGELPQEKLEDLREWFERFHTKFPPDEAAELRSALGIEQHLRDVPFRELVPPGWFAELLALVEESEAPAPFYFLASLSVMSQCLGRNFIIHRGTHSIGIEVSSLLISPAGRGRRSTACDFVAYEIGRPAGCSVISDSFSYEAFGDALVETAGHMKVPASRTVDGARALIYAGEMSTLLGKGSYADSIIPKLTDMIGKMSLFEWRTVKRGGKIAFVRPCVNALFTSAPDWLVENLPPIVFGGGMLSRFLICVQDQMEKLVTWSKPLDEKQKANVIAGLKRLQGKRGTFDRPEGAAYKWYDKWYMEHSRRYLDGDIPDERMAPYFSRKHDHLLRLSALLTIAADEPYVFTVERFQQALRILDWLELNVPQAYAQMALSPIAAAQRAACEVLRRNGGLMEHARLQRRMYRHTPLKEQFSGIMESLVAMEVVKVVPTVTGRGKNYVLVKALE